MIDKRRDAGFLYPVLPLKGLMPLPKVESAFLVKRKNSLNALNFSLSHLGGTIFLGVQRDSSVDDVSPSDLLPVGVLAQITRVVPLDGDEFKVFAKGNSRAKVLSFDSDNSSFLRANLDNDIFEVKGDTEEAALIRSNILSILTDSAELNTSEEIISILGKIEDPGVFADAASHYLNLSLVDRQSILESFNVVERLLLLRGFISETISAAEVDNRVRSRVKNQMEKTQREYYLNEQLKAIQKELDECSKDNQNISFVDKTGEISILEEKVKKACMTDEAKEKAFAELKKMSAMSPASAEANIIRNYVEWLIDLPWKSETTSSVELDDARTILDSRHYGMDKVKERILERLAVRKRRGKSSNEFVICLIGAPGVGKTSLAKSIAKAEGRKFVSLSLGGVRDEAEIRGHRKTYIGAMPGKIIHAMKKAKTKNPIILLDEIDKMGSDFRGDPASALLEVLDREQNSEFVDHYIEVGYDLSEVTFLATANSYDMPAPLLDRMDVIRISGYTEEEKLCIAHDYLLPRQREENGLTESELTLSKDALKLLIRNYTREGGVRGLEKELANIARKALIRIMSGKVSSVKLVSGTLHQFAGPPKVFSNKKRRKDEVGIVNGLAYTEAGGDVLVIESVAFDGKGEIKCTGKLGDVMKESIQAARSWVLSRADIFSINPEDLRSKDLHVHVPEGAVPKDGPSAGVAMSVCILSSLVGKAVNSDLAMTGEVTLSGRVLPVGGIKEKLLAAMRQGISTVLIPEDNRKNIQDLPKSAVKSLNIVTVASMDDVLKYAFNELITAGIPMDNPEILRKERSINIIEEVATL